MTFHFCSASRFGAEGAEEGLLTKFPREIFCVSGIAAQEMSPPDAFG
jgi:hypothetical protein